MDLLSYPFCFNSSALTGRFDFNRRPMCNCAGDKFIPSYSSSLKGFYKDLCSFLTYFSLSVHIFQSVPYFDYNVD